MLDFTSALYLGLRHAWASLGTWDALTLGRPAALDDPPGAATVAAQLALLQGCEAATLLPSTLHLFWDLFRMLGRERMMFLCDSGMYPIAQWGVQRAAATGVPVRTFPHHDAGALAPLALRAAEQNRRPVVVTDGYCPRCGAAAPIRAYSEIARRHDGYLVLDDTQALGILGEVPSAANPYGDGGGGSLRWHGTFGPHILVAASLAKGFGAPIAVLAASQRWIDRFREESDTRVHCSPPSVAVIRAAARALHVNRLHGDTLRRRLSQLTSRLREQLTRAGLAPLGRLPFPSLSFLSTHWPGVSIVHQQLLRSGVRALLTRACRALTVSLTFLVTARHRLADIDTAGRIAAHAMRSPDLNLSHQLGAV